MVERALLLRERTGTWKQGSLKQVKDHKNAPGNGSRDV